MWGGRASAMAEARELTEPLLAVPPRPRTPVPAVNATAARREAELLPRTWRVVHRGEVGVARLSASLAEVARIYGVPMRDVLLLTHRTELGPSSSAVLVRPPGAVVLALEHIGGVVTADSVVLTDSAGSAEFAAELADALAPTSPAEGLPWELRAVEAALSHVAFRLEEDAAALEAAAAPALDALRQAVTPATLEAVRRLKTSLGRVFSRCDEVGSRLQALLGDDEDMASLIFGDAEASKRQQDVEVVEACLQAYHIHVGAVQRRLATLNEAVEDVEDLAELDLDAKRNRLVQAEIVLTIATFAIGVASLVTGIFGMNLASGWEESPKAFVEVIGALCALGALTFAAVLWRLRCARVLGETAVEPIPPRV